MQGLGGFRIDEKKPKEVLKQVIAADINKSVSLGLPCYKIPN